MNYVISDGVETATAARLKALCLHRMIRWWNISLV